MTVEDFAALHDSADPLILFNVWDAGSARAVAETGARAIATGSLSMAGAQGVDDGENLPFDGLLQTVQQIAGAIDLPLTVDFETGYAGDVSTLARNAGALRESGAVGCNIEDRLIDQPGLRDVDEQCERIETVAAEGLFVNARTDIFLGPLMAGDDPNRPELLEAAIERAHRYRDAGAGCFFVPGLGDPALLGELCERTEIPVNAMRLDGMIANGRLGRLGVSRISYGPAPWREAMEFVRDAAVRAMAS